MFFTAGLRFIVGNFLGSRLNSREKEILEWLHAGKTNREILQILNLSEHTVKNLVRNILIKLHVKNRVQAVAKAISTKLISTS